MSKDLFFMIFFVLGIVFAQYAGTALGNRLAQSNVQASNASSVATPTIVPTDAISSTPIPTVLPDISEIEDNPDRADDDNPGESNRNRRGRDH